MGDQLQATSLYLSGFRAEEAASKESKVVEEIEEDEEENDEDEGEVQQPLKEEDQKGEGEGAAEGETKGEESDSDSESEPESDQELQAMNKGKKKKTYGLWKVMRATDPTALLTYTGSVLKIKHMAHIRKVEWHKKGDYVSTLSVSTDHAPIIVHQVFPLAHS